MSTTSELCHLAMPIQFSYLIEKNQMAQASFESYALPLRHTDFQSTTENQSTNGTRALLGDPNDKNRNEKNGIMTKYTSDSAAESADLLPTHPPPPCAPPFWSCDCVEAVDWLSGLLASVVRLQSTAHWKQSLTDGRQETKCSTCWTCVSKALSSTLTLLLCFQFAARFSG